MDVNHRTRKRFEIEFGESDFDDSKSFIVELFDQNLDSVVHASFIQFIISIDWH